MKTYEFILNAGDAKITVLAGGGEKDACQITNEMTLIHNHSFCEIFTVVNTPFSVKTLNGNFYVDESCIITVPKNCYHFSFCERHNFSMLISAEKIRNKKSGFYDKLSLILNEPDICKYAAGQSLIFIASEVNACLQEKEPDILYIKQMLSAFLIKLTGSVDKEMQVIQNADNNYIFKINAYLDKNYAERVYIEDLAEELKLGKRQVLRVIKKNFNITFSELLIKKRLAVAA